MTLLNLRLSVICVLCCLSTVGCGGSGGTGETTETAPPTMEATPSDVPEVLTTRELRRRLRANEAAKFERVGTDIVEAHLFQSGVKDIAGLKGLPLRFLDLGMCEVSDLSAIEGMPLTTLILEDTKVSDLSVVKGMRLEVLQLQETDVTDLSMLAGMPIRELNLKNVAIDSLDTIATLPLQTLWVPGTNVTDISPLAGKAMVSLDIEGTQVTSLEPLAAMSSLKRLNIVNTPISDLTPLKNLQLQRITLTPQSITKGIDVLRSMPRLSQILTTMEGNPQQSATEFWQKYDAGVWSAKPEVNAEDKAKATEDQPEETEAPEAVKVDEPKADAPEPAAVQEAASPESNKKG